MKIPKIIHQIWLGGIMPKEFEIYAETWKNKHKNWKYILWDEKKIKILKHIVFKDYEKLKNFSEKSDYLRFCIILEYGGVYVDTDFECLQPLDNLIKSTSFFIGITEKYLNTGLFGAIKNHSILKNLLNETPQRITKYKNENSFFKLGPAFVDEIVKRSKEEKMIIPRKLFYPFTRFDLINKEESKNAYAIHHYAMSWNPIGRLKASLIRKVKQLYSKLGDIKIR